MELILTDGTDSRFIALCRELDAYLNAAMGSDTQRTQYDRYNTLEHIHDAALILEDGGVVACAGYKRYDEQTAEIKRVFTVERCRHRGYAKSLLQALETRAKGQGYARLLLETGIRLQAAQKLYGGIGFSITDNYGPYACLPQSVCMEKRL